jgi:hypothetical protein
MLEGLRKFWFRSALRTGCSYFDMRNPGRPRQFDVQYAEATLAAIGRRPPGGAPPPASEDFCTEAFKSQLGNSDVRQAFFKDVYPRLSPSKRSLRTS